MNLIEEKHIITYFIMKYEMLFFTIFNLMNNTDVTITNLDKKFGEMKRM